jgi:hypothetical protein
MEQRFQSVSIGFLNRGRRIRTLQTRVTLESALEICSRFQEPR